MPGYVHQVPAALASDVASCVGYDYRLPPDAVHHGIPSTALTVIFAFDEPLDAGWIDEGGQRFDVLVAGLHTKAALIRTHGSQCGIQLGLTPSGARRLLGVPAAALAGAMCAADVPGIPPDLQPRLQGADWRGRFRLLDAWLLGCARRSRAAPRPALARAWELVIAPSSPSIDAVAAEVGWSRRHLLSQFRAEFGPAPKAVARVARLGRARRLLESGVAAADVAARAGYADQPHLTREFRALAGLTPAQLAGNFPILQDDGAEGRRT